MAQPIRMLAWCDSPATTTGFGIVSRGILDYLSRNHGYQIEIIGINDTGGYKEWEEYPFKIYPARTGIQTHGDFHGKVRFAETILGRDPECKPPWDIVFTINDPFVLEAPIGSLGIGVSKMLSEAQKGRRKLVKKKQAPANYMFRTVQYVPVDSELAGNWIENSIAYADCIVPYTKYALQEVESANNSLKEPINLKEKLHKPIYHGVDMEAFKPLPDEEKKKLRDSLFKEVPGVSNSTFILLSIARNQHRKDIPRTLKIFKEFKRRRPDSFLYLHMKENDAWGSLRTYATKLGLDIGKDISFPTSFDTNKGIPKDVINSLYNVSDAVISTSHGEGWGFHNSEGFATKTIVIGPDNSVYPELFNYDPDEYDISNINEIKDNIRGIPMIAGSNNTEWVNYGPHDMERYRPIVNVEDAVKKLIWVYDNPEEVKKIEDRAYKYVKSITWESIGEQWHKLFTKQLEILNKDRENALKK